MLLFSNMSDETPGFSLELSSDLRDMRDWVHEFAASVIRPAAAEWDEREEVPWPIIHLRHTGGVQQIVAVDQQNAGGHWLTAHTLTLCLYG